MFRWKPAVVLLISLWLPVQGVAAVIMPFCTHSLSGSAADDRSVNADAVADEGLCADHAGHAGTVPHSPAEDQGSTSGLSACDDCGHCHLSCAFSLPSPGLPAAELISFPAPSFAPSFRLGTVLDLLNRPPLLTLI
jgi:hypothetical protein